MVRVKLVEEEPYDEILCRLLHLEKQHNIIHTKILKTIRNFAHAMKEQLLPELYAKLKRANFNLTKIIIYIYHDPESELPQIFISPLVKLPEETDVEEELRLMDELTKRYYETARSVIPDTAWVESYPEPQHVEKTIRGDNHYYEWVGEYP